MVAPKRAPPRCRFTARRRSLYVSSHEKNDETLRRAAMVLATRRESVEVLSGRLA